MKDKIITAILVLIVGLFLLPLAKFNDQQVTNELKGFSARDIQFIEQIGFVDNLDGSWTLTLTGLTPSPYFTYFDYKPIDSLAQNRVIAIRISSTTQLQILYESGIQFTSSTFTLWGGDVS